MIFKKKIYLKKISIFYRNDFSAFLKKIKNKILVKNSGPEVLKNNLINGLKALNYHVLLNPKLKNLTKFCIVLDDISALKKLIYYKTLQNKKIKIFAGPNLMVQPNENNKILFSDQIDKIIVPSNWVKKLYIESSDSFLKNKIKIWPCGINHMFWKPKKINKKKIILVYIKNFKNKKIINRYIDFLKKNNLKYFVLSYGKYKPIDFLKKLRQSKCIIYFNSTESQGLSYFESWSTNVPVFIYKIDGFFKNKKIKKSKCPYLEDNLGSNFEDLKSFKKIIFSKKKYPTRKIILKKYTLKKSALNLLNEIKKK